MIRSQVPGLASVALVKALLTVVVSPLALTVVCRVVKQRLAHPGVFDPKRDDSSDSSLEIVSEFPGPRYWRETPRAYPDLDAICNMRRVHIALRQLCGQRSEREAAMNAL